MARMGWLVLLTAAFASLAVFEVRNLRALLRLRRNGTRVPGTVVSAERSNRVVRTSEGPGVDKTIDIAFRFETVDGRAVEVRPKIKSAVRTVHTGQHVTVAYDPANPEYADILDSKGAVWLHAVAIALSVVICASCAWTVVRPGP
ncbi:hypothetical protein GCM10009834_37400 [Streptomonospora arabica]